MAKANDGDRVRVHYTGRLDDESEFDTSRGGEPLEFTLGEGSVIPGFEKAVRGMEPGEEVETRIPAEEAYGERRDDLTLTVSRGEIPPELEPEVGGQLRMKTGDGHEFVVTITDVGDEHVTLDANHPLAGEALNFQIELIEIL